MDSLAVVGLSLAVGALVPAALLRLVVFFADRGIRPVNRPNLARDPGRRREHDEQLELINHRYVRNTRVIVFTLLTVAAVGVLLLLIGLVGGGRP